MVVATFDRASELTPGSSATADDAVQRWGALRKLDSSLPLRAELADAKVAQATIESLYPFEFTNCIQKLLPLITPDRVANLSMDALLQLVNKLVTLCWLLPTDVAALVAEPPSEEEFAATLAPLAAHLFNVLEEMMPHPLARHTVARTASVLLNHVSVLMEHFQPGDFATREAVYAYFLLVTDVILPGFEHEVAA